MIKDGIHKNKGQPLFKEEGKIIEVKEFDTYLIKKENGGKIKRLISHLRKLANSGETPEEAECQFTF